MGTDEMETKQVLAICLIALVTLEPCSALAIKSSGDENPSESLSGGSSGESSGQKKKSGDNTTTAEDGQSNSVVMGGSFVLGLATGAAVMKSRRQGFGGRRRLF